MWHQCWDIASHMEGTSAIFLKTLCRHTTFFLHIDRTIYLSPGESNRGRADNQQRPVGTIVAHHCNSLESLPETHVIGDQDTSTMPDTIPCKEVVLTDQTLANVFNQNSAPSLWDCQRNRVSGSGGLAMTRWVIGQQLVLTLLHLSGTAWGWTSTFDPPFPSPHLRLFHHSLFPLLLLLPWTAFVSPWIAVVRGTRRSLAWEQDWVGHTYSSSAPSQLKTKSSIKFLVTLAHPSLKYIIYYKPSVL